MVKNKPGKVPSLIKLISLFVIRRLTANPGRDPCSA